VYGELFEEEKKMIKKNELELEKDKVKIEALNKNYKESINNNKNQITLNFHQELHENSKVKVLEYSNNSNM
jgi:hypothetical protein